MCTSFWARGFAHVSRLTQLQELIIASTLCDDDGLEHVAKLPKLRKLNLSECASVTAEGLAHVGRMKRLQWLRLYGVVLSDDAVKAVSHIRTVIRS